MEPPRAHWSWFVAIMEQHLFLAKVLTARLVLEGKGPGLPTGRAPAPERVVSALGT